MLDIRCPAPSGAAAGAEDLSTARGPVPNGGSNVSEEQNSRLYNENNDYGERDYAPRKSGKKKKRKESGGHVGEMTTRAR
mgnify:FL=1